MYRRWISLLNIGNTMKLHVYYLTAQSNQNQKLIINNFSCEIIKPNLILISEINESIYLWQSTTTTTAAAAANSNNQLEARHRGEHSASDFGINRKLICDFLLVISTNLHPILHRFQVVADYRSNFR